MNISRRSVLKGFGASLAAASTHEAVAAEPTRGASTPDHAYEQPRGVFVHRHALAKLGIKSANDVFVHVTYNNPNAERNQIDSADLYVNAKNSNIINGTIAYGDAEYFIRTHQDGSHTVLNQTKEGQQVSSQQARDVVVRARDFATGGTMAPLPSAETLFREVQSATRSRAPAHTPGG